MHVLQQLVQLGAGHKGACEGEGAQEADALPERERGPHARDRHAQQPVRQQHLGAHLTGDFVRPFLFIITIPL